MRTDGLRSPEWLLAQCEKRLRTCWAEVVCGRAMWSPRFDLGTSQFTGVRLRAVWSGLHLDTLEWRDWVSAAGAGVELVPRTVSYARGMDQEIPAAVTVADIEVAARLLGAAWVDRLARTARRRATVAAAFPELDDVAGLLRAVDGSSDVDFEITCRAAAWFAAPHPAGLTARQVPVEGMGSKWLDEHAGVVRRLAGLDDLGLLPGRPSRVHVTYLDPAHLARGGRRHDVATVGDVDTVAYRPRIVLICENRDTAQQFPPLAGVIAIEGDGRGARAVASLEWVHAAEHRFYWGDMDADGLEILHGFRVAGLAVESLFMDVPTYELWEKYGVDRDHGGRPLGPRTPREVSLLTPSERELYLLLCSPDWRRHRRIEQERIPLDVARLALSEKVKP
ncbi:DUF3322 and DUF2220 domain-containing protein [Nocardioides sp. Kera G14]|uniref:DUF3322 and DUF2220 domain-containing protein n=1 Tax=Nocardioides sp. Kera G14 TaxID=2884264 RepID=UPI001D1285FD|nr:DUF3322 and DUF2220 domain-containing protein [Nocardioides sp. Kera G14]UDY23666.1 DUF2220 family protein [Nocardioides sp. Kera G14]